MKKTPLYIIALLLLVLSSCTKKYSCKCTTTLTKEGYYPKVTECTEAIKKNSTKKKATQICNNTGIQMQANTAQLWYGYATVTTKCELKDF